MGKGDRVRTERAIQRLTTTIAATQKAAVPKALRVIELASFVVTIAGFVVTDPWFFWLWVIAFFTLSVGLTFHVWQTATGALRWCGTIAIAATLVTVGARVVFVSAPLRIEVFRYDGEHLDPLQIRWCPMAT